MLLQVNHSGLSDADLITSSKCVVRIALQGLCLWQQGSAVCTLQVCTLQECTLQEQITEPKGDNMYLNHVPFLKFIKDLQSLYSARSAQASVSSFTHICRQGAMQTLSRDTALLSAAGSHASIWSSTCACPEDQCAVCRWCPDPQHGLSPIH